MLFASRVAENANRRSRLIFQDPPHVPAPSREEKSDANSEPDVLKLMENKEDPFGPDIFIPPLKVASTNASAEALTDSRQNAAHLDVGGKKQSQTRFDGNASVRSRSASPRPPYDSSHGIGKPPVLPMPAILLAGGNDMPMLSALANGMLMNRVAHGALFDGEPITVSVALPGSRQRQASIESPQQNSRRTSDIFIGVSMVNIPQTPFDPFGNEIPVNHRRDDSTRRSSVSTVVSKNIPPQINGEVDGTEIVDGNEADDEGKDAQSQSNDGDNDLDTAPSKEVVGKPKISQLQLPYKSRLKRAPACPSTFHNSFMDLQHHSTTMDQRRTQSERDVFQSFTPSMTKSFAQSLGATDKVGHSKENERVHLLCAEKQVHTEQAPIVESRHASIEPRNDSPTCEPVKQDEQQQHSTNRSLRKAIMRKIRKLGKSKK